jgi:hypothetical protein
VPAKLAVEECSQAIGRVTEELADLDQKTAGKAAAVLDELASPSSGPPRS